MGARNRERAPAIWSQSLAPANCGSRIYGDIKGRSERQRDSVGLRKLVNSGLPFRANAQCGKGRGRPEARDFRKTS
jgi:hypothetical protein